MPEFYEAHARKVLVRSPVEYTVAALRQLEAKTDMSTPAANLDGDGAHALQPRRREGLGEDLDWMNTGTIFARASFTNTLVTNRGAAGTRIDPAALLAGKPLATARDVVVAAAERLGLSDAPAGCQAVWEKYVDESGRQPRFLAEHRRRRSIKARGLFHLMLTSAEYHLC